MISTLAMSAFLLLSAGGAADDVVPETQSVTPLAAQMAVVQAAPQPVRPAFRPINHEEDYSALADPALRQDLWTRLKYIPLGETTYLTLGGELRLRPEWRENQRWGRGLQDDDGNFQQRTRLWADLRLNAHVRAFVDIQHATSHDYDAGAQITEEGRADWHQAFVETSGSLGGAEVQLRLGRQEMGLGGFRLFDMREGANTRRALDLVRVTARSGAWDGGAFAGHTVREDFGSFNNRTNRDYELQGLHLGRAFGQGPDASRWEVALVATQRAVAAFDTAPPGPDDRFTLSVRHAGRSGAWDYDAEAIGQWGEFRDLDIRAWYVSAIVGRALDHDWRPRLALRVDVGSGDRDASDGRMGVYAPLFARPLTYNGDFGPQNQIVVQPMLTLQPTPRFVLDLSTAGLWRTSKDDAVYALSGQVLRSAWESDSAYIGQRYVVTGRYAVNPFTTLGFYVNYTTAGDVFKDSGTAGDMLYAAPYLTFRF